MKSDSQDIIGHVYILDTPPNGYHPSIAIASIIEQCDCYLFVNLTTKKDDKSCIIQPYEYIPYVEGISNVTAESTIYYKQARELTPKQMKRLLKPESLAPEGYFPEEIFNRIIQGGINSPFMKKKYKQLLKDWGY